MIKHKIYLDYSMEETNEININPNEFKLFLITIKKTEVLKLSIVWQNLLILFQEF